MPVLCVALIAVVASTLPLLFVEPVLAKQTLDTGETIKIFAVTFGKVHGAQQGRPIDRLLPEWISHKPPAPALRYTSKSNALVVWIDSKDIMDANPVVRDLVLFDEHGCSYGSAIPVWEPSDSVVKYRFDLVPHAGQSLYVRAGDNPPLPLPTPIPSSVPKSASSDSPAIGTVDNLQVTVGAVSHEAWTGFRQTSAAVQVTESGKPSAAWQPLGVRAESAFGEVRESRFPMESPQSLFRWEAFCAQDPYVKLSITLGVLRPDLMRPDAEWRLPWDEVFKYQVAADQKTRSFDKGRLRLRFSRGDNAAGTGPQVIWLSRNSPGLQVTFSIRQADKRPTSGDAVWVTPTSGISTSCILPEKFDSEGRDLVLSAWAVKSADLLVKKGASL